MEDISLKPLSDGLGFHEKYKDFNPSIQSEKKPPFSLDFSEDSSEHLLQDKLDLEDSKTYDYLLSILEKPCLGDKEVDTSFFSAKKEVDKEEVDKKEASSSLNSSTALPRSLDSDLVSTPLFTKPAMDSVIPSFLSGNTISPNTFDPSYKIKKENHSADKATKVDNALTPLNFKNSFYLLLKSGFMDMLLSALLFLPPFMLFVFLTQSNPVSVLVAIWPKILFTFLVFNQIYLLVFRLFCFETYGESVSKIRLFSLTKNQAHPLLLFWRFLITCLTGVLLLPIMSLFLRRDIIAKLTRLYFYKISP